LKNKIVQIFSHFEFVDIQCYDSLLSVMLEMKEIILKECGVNLSTNQAKVSAVIDEVIHGLENIDDNFKQNQYLSLLQNLLWDHKERQIIRQLLFSLAFELKLALEREEKLIEELEKDKELYVTYLENIQIGSIPTSKTIIGPFQYSIRELEKKRIVVSSPYLASIRNDAVIKMSSLIPGIVNLVTKTSRSSKLTELRLGEMKHIKEPTVIYEGITYNVANFLTLLKQTFPSSSRRRSLRISPILPPSQCMLIPTPPTPTLICSYSTLSLPSTLSAPSITGFSSPEPDSALDVNTSITQQE